jgi:hypothetical protein
VQTFEQQSSLMWQDGTSVGEISAQHPASALAAWLVLPID